VRDLAKFGEKLLAPVLWWDLDQVAGRDEPLVTDANSVNTLAFCSVFVLDGEDEGSGMWVDARLTKTGDQALKMYVSSATESQLFVRSSKGKSMDVMQLTSCETEVWTVLDHFIHG